MTMISCKARISQIIRGVKVELITLRPNEKSIEQHIQDLTRDINIAPYSVEFTNTSTGIVINKDHGPVIVEKVYS